MTDRNPAIFEIVRLKLLLGNLWYGSVIGFGSLTAEMFLRPTSTIRSASESKFISAVLQRLISARKLPRWLGLRVLSFRNCWYLLWKPRRLSKRTYGIVLLGRLQIIFNVKYSRSVVCLSVVLSIIRAVLAGLAPLV